MATSGAFTTSNKYINYRIEVTQNWQDVANNYSNVTVKVFVYRTNTGYTTYGSGTLYCGIDGTGYSQGITSSQKITNSGIYLFERTVNIYHNGDGTKSIWVSANIQHERVTSSDQGFTVTLDTIPRRSTITGISGDWFGSDMTVTIDQKSSSFTTSVFVKTPNSDWVNVIWKQSGTSFTFTLPMSLVTSIPNATECSGTVKIRTYNGDTEIGDDDWGKWMGVPDWVKPSISNVQLDTDTQVNGQWMFVQWKSKLKVTTSASGSYGSSITSIRVDFDGSQYWGGEIWTGIISNYGARPVTVHVWDSRNRYASWSGTAHVEWYGNPWGTLSAYRCDADGNRDDINGTHVKAIYSGDKAQLNGANTFSLKVDHRVQGGDWEIHNDVETNQATSGTELVLNYNSETFSLEKAYEIRLRVSDWYTTTTYVVPISTAFVLIDFKAGGKGLGFGRVATTDHVAQFNMGLQIFSGRENNPNLGADIAFANVARTSQEIGVCGGIPNSDTLLNVYRFTSDDAGSSGALVIYDRWNVMYNNCVNNYFKGNIVWNSTSEKQIRMDGSTSYHYWGANNGNIGAWDDSVGLLWNYDKSSQTVNLKAGYQAISDRRKKYDFDEFTNWDDFYNFYMSLKPQTFKYNEDMSERTYIGMVAQDVMESVVNNNLSNERLALVRERPNDDYEDGREYSLAYQELISLNIKMIQKHEEEIKELNNTIAKQQEEIDQLKDMVNQLVNQGGK